MSLSLTIVQSKGLLTPKALPVGSEAIRRTLASNVSLDAVFDHQPLNNKPQPQTWLLLAALVSLVQT